MSSLSDLPEVIGFFSYSREDDESYKGRLSALREGIQGELSAQLGRSKTTFRLWQDREAIAPGRLWESEIKTAVEQSVFFIPIVTPRAVNSNYCKFEFEAFLARERALGRTDLVFPILYVPVPALQNEAQWRDHPVLSAIAKRQYVDWQTFRYSDVNTPAMREAVGQFCNKIVEALLHSWLSPEERQRLEEAAVKERKEEQRRQQVAEAKRRAEEDAQREKDEAEARRVEEDRRRQEAEAKQRTDEEERLQRTEAEARQRTEEERLDREAKAKQRADQELAFAAAKRADVVAAIDGFLANHPDSRHTAEAQTLRAALVARDDAGKVAMANDDVAVLKAFLTTYPTGSAAEQVRGRLRVLEPVQVRVAPIKPSGPVEHTARRLRYGAAGLLALALLIVACYFFYVQNTPSGMSHVQNTPSGTGYTEIASSSVNDRTIRVLAVGSGSQNASISQINDVAHVTVGGRVIVIRPDGRVTVDGATTSYGPFEELDVIIGDGNKIEIKIVH